MKRKNVKLMIDLQKILSKCEKVNNYDTGKAKESDILSYSLTELNESFRRFIEELFPQLIHKDLEEEEIYNLLHEIGEEFRHILYHIKDSNYYNYLF